MLTIPNRQKRTPNSITIKATIVPNPGNGNPKGCPIDREHDQGDNRYDKQADPDERNDHQRNLGVGEDGLDG